MANATALTGSRNSGLANRSTTAWYDNASLRALDVADQVQRTAFDFVVDATEIFAQNS
jgi:hypothetical protein